MLDPEYIFHMAEGAEDVSEQLHQAILNAIVGRLMARLAKGENYLTSTDRWNLKVLSDAGYLMEDIQQEIAARTKQQLEEIRRIFEDAAIESFAWDMAVYQAAGLSPAPLAKSPQLIRLLQRDYAKTAGEWQNFTGTLADAAQQTFIRQCDEAYHLVTSGAMGYPQAVRRAIEAIATDGVTVRYTRRNEAGQQEVYHTDTIETATLRAVRTGARQACDAITDARMDEMDWDIVLASSHLGARTGDGGENYTNHSWWQGKFYSRSGKDKRFSPWSVVGEGDVQGFGGPNCRHSKGPGDGVHNPFEHFDSEENRKKELLDQRQRLLERRIRKTRREVMTLQGAIDKTPDEATRLELQEAYRKKAAKLMDQEAEYDAFCKENDLRKLYDRLEVARYGPKQARAAERAARADPVDVSTLTDSKKGGIIDQKEQPREKPDVHTIGHIDREKYKGVSADIRTDEVVLTDNQRDHIISRRGQEFFDKYSDSFKSVAEDPDFIFADKSHPNTAIACKTLNIDGAHINLVIRLAVKDDKLGRKNSIITALTESDKRYAQRLRNNKPLYKRE